DAASGSTARTVELATGKGDALAKATLIPEGWTFGELTQRTVSKGEVTHLLRPTLALASDPTMLDVPTLFAGASAVSDTVAGGSGTLVSSVTSFHADVQQQFAGGITLSGHLLESTVENGQYTTKRTLDAGRRVIAVTDQAGTTWVYHYDASDRLRAV